MGKELCDMTFRGSEGDSFDMCNGILIELKY